MKNLVENSALLNELLKDNSYLIYMSLYRKRNETTESYTAKRSVVSECDLAYEWFKTLYWDEVCENDKYVGITLTFNEEIYVEGKGITHRVEKWVIRKDSIQYALDNAKDSRHKLNLIRRNFRLVK